MVQLKPLILAFLFILNGAALTACKEAPQSTSQVATPSINTSSASEISSKKLGAAIQFTHSYDSSSNINQVENFELTFQPTQAIDMLSIELSSPDNILQGGDQSITRSVMGTSPVIIPVSILAGTEGKFYLNIIVQTERDGRRLGRAFAVAINVGTRAAAQKIESENAERVHVMPAQEEIR